MLWPVSSHTDADQIFYLGVPGGQCLSRQPSRDLLLGVPGQGKELPSAGSPHPSGVLQGTRQASVQRPG